MLMQTWVCRADANEAQISFSHGTYGNRFGVSLIERSDTLYKDIPPSLISNPHEDHSLSAQEIIENMNIPYQVMFLDLEVMRYKVMFLEMMRPMQWLLGIPIGSDRCCLRNTHYSLWMKLRSPR